MGIGKVNHNITTVLEGKSLEEVKIFKCLGVMLNNCEDQQVEIKNKVENAACIIKLKTDLRTKQKSQEDQDESIRNWVFPYTHIRV